MQICRRRHAASRTNDSGRRTPCWPHVRVSAECVQIMLPMKARVAIEIPVDQRAIERQQAIQSGIGQHRHRRRSSTPSSETSAALTWASSRSRLPSMRAPRIRTPCGDVVREVRLGQQRTQQNRIDAAARRAPSRHPRACVCPKAACRTDRSDRQPCPPAPAARSIPRWCSDRSVAAAAAARRPRAAAPVTASTIAFASPASGLRCSVPFSRSLPAGGTTVDAGANRGGLEPRRRPRAHFRP